MKIIKRLLAILSVFLLAFFSTSAAIHKKYNSNDLDRINSYSIEINPDENGELDMKYDISWEVLDSISEGPLEWVEIGIPNKYVSNITALTNNIKKIKYYSDSGSFIRIDFDKKYFAGSIVNFSFSFHQSRMYFLNGEDVYYNFRPGYFEDILVTSLTVKWNKTNVIDHDGFTDEDDTYLIRTESLDYGKTVDLYTKYNQSVFNNLSTDKQYSDNYLTTSDIISIVAVCGTLLAIVIFVVVLYIKKSDPYMKNRGFYGDDFYFRPYYYHRHYHSSSGVDKKGSRIIPPGISTGGGHGSSFHGGSSCACACACAGGGRAGCSKKDFYNNVNAQKIIDIIDEDLNKKENATK